MLDLCGYKITGTIYASNSSLVYSAIHETDDAPVVLRTCMDSASSSQWARLSSSAEILKSFKHPSIVQAEAIQDKKGKPVIVMPDDKSINLHEYLDSAPEKQLPIDHFLDIAIQLADALSVIHHAQVIHKDLHPGNIIINPDTRRAKVIDFGLASLLSREQPVLEPPENLEGVLAYISPEQTGRMNRSLDYRSDFYTLGVTFYELLTGQLPFNADDAIGVVHAHIAHTQKPACDIRPDIPRPLSSIIDKMINKTAESRYQSATGLKNDLEVCRRYIIAGSSVPDFTLGLNDISERFQVPQLLYGREQELQALMDNFYQAAKGKPRLMAIKGFSGIGKSALVHEVHKPIAAHSGIFTSGKFDQFQKNIPYSALKQVFSDWIQHALSLKEHALQELKEQLLTSLGNNARALIDFMDIFKVLFGELPPLPKLGAQETLNRFNAVIHRFVQTITAHRPLVIFIDDLQWADQGTLNLLPQLMSAGESIDLDIDQANNKALDSNMSGCRLLILVAYRDNEVDESHPTVITLKQLQEEYPDTKTLSLQPLSVQNVNQLLMDTLYQSDSTTFPLAELISNKTQGNPFFINEFLKTLYSENLLNFDLEQQKWVWSLRDIDAKGITNNVVELMLLKMQQLPSDTQHMLQLASCIGSLFDLETLSIISEQDMSSTVRLLWPALKEGLLLQEGGDWLPGMVEQHETLSEFTRKQIENSSASRSQLKTQISPTTPHCRFLHDRMLQAAYQSISRGERETAHLRIARLLYKHSSPQQREELLFSLVEQFNQGRKLIKSDEERIDLARLNLRASTKALQASAWQAALGFTKVGIELLPENNWEQEYSLSYDLQLLFVECSFLVSNHQQAKESAESLLGKAKTNIEKAKICYLLLTQQMAGDLGYCIEKGIEGLRHLNEDIPNIVEVDPAKIGEEGLALKRAQLEHENAKLLLPVSEKTSLSFKLYAHLAGACQMSGNKELLFYLVYKGMQSAYKHEPNQYSIILYTLYTMLLAKMSKHDEAKLIAIKSIELLDRFPQSTDLPSAYMLIGTFVWHFSHTLQDSIEMQLRAHHAGYDYGDINFGVVGSYANHIINAYAQGLPLTQFKPKIATLTHLLKKHELKIAGGSYYYRLIDMLTFSTTDNLLQESSFHPDEWKLIQSCILKPFIEHLRNQWYFWSDQDEELDKGLAEAEVGLPLLYGFVCTVEHDFFMGLNTLKKGQSIEATINKFVGLQELCSENFEHKLLILRAEHSRYIENDPVGAARFYEQAIASAAANGFLQYEALANELYGDYWISVGLYKTAMSHIKQALSLYQTWGCAIKIKNLGDRYRELLGEELEGVLVRYQVDASRQSRSRYSVTHTRTQTSSHYGLDLSSVMKSTQAISSELDIRHLIGKVMLALLENSGAQNAALILNGPEGPVIEASIKTQIDSEINLESKPLNDASDLPVSLISYVLRTNSEQIHQDETRSAISSANTAFLEDSYLQTHQPKSVLCVPVSYREKVIGALYLENTLTHKAFPRERLDIIKMLLAQAAISFENARLFNEVSELNTNLEEKVRRRTRELDKSNSDLNIAVAQLEVANKELETFSYTVSHDLRAPLRTIKGYSAILQEDFLEELDPEAKMLGDKVIQGAEKMGNLIEGLLDLSRMQKMELIRGNVSISDMAEEISKELRENEPNRNVIFDIDKGLVVDGDQRMLYSVMENLFSNAWKYSSKTENAEISFKRTEKGGEEVYCVQDNGAGFDMKYIDKLFGTFSRLHSDHEFKGTGVGLSTVKHIVQKHGGRIWAEAEVGKGASFFFTLGNRYPTQH